jgi:3-deoxy-D-manno-octulosonate 8-phosphate phosphatase (KDO 8-P phosphatase)
MIDEKAKNIELLVLDVDGVMTDGRIVMNDLGQELKFFNVRDGHGIRLLLYAGVEVAIITGRSSETVRLRAADLGITMVYQGVKDKETICKKIMTEKGFKKDQVCCMGDDLPDIPMLRCAGLPVAVADATIETREAALYVTKAPGGYGAVREMCEIILKAKGAWPGNKGNNEKTKLGFT